MTKDKITEFIKDVGATYNATYYYRDLRKSSIRIKFMGVQATKNKTGICRKAHNKFGNKLISCEFYDYIRPMDSVVLFIQK